MRVSSPKKCYALRSLAVLSTQLPEELLDKIFSEVSPVSNAWRYDNKLCEATSLQRASLVCSAWRGPAQRRLLCLVKLGNTHALHHLRTRSRRDVAAMCKVLTLCLYDSTISSKDRLESHMLADYATYFLNLQQLRIETHSTKDDPTLASFIKQHSTLQVLVVAHAYSNDPYDSDYENDEEEDDASLWSVGSYRHSTPSIACFPSLLHVSIPALPRLQHLAINRLHLGNLPDTQIGVHASLLNVALIRAAFPGHVLDGLLQERTKPLQHLAVIQPDAVTKEDLIKSLRKHSPEVETLSVTFPWPGCALPDQRGSGAKLSGILQAVLPTCTRLKKLYCQDPALDLNILLSLQHLQDVRITIDCSQDFGRYLEMEERRTSMSFKVDLLGETTLGGDKITALVKTWKERGVDIDRSWQVDVHVRALQDFYALLPDPITG